jgi:toxin ParE1/3/4
VRLSVSVIASRQIESIYVHILRNNPRAATEIVTRIAEVAKFIASNPGVGRATMVRGMRAFPVVPYPYVIYFRKFRDEVRIVRVLHSARKRPELREDGPDYKAELALVR